MLANGNITDEEYESSMAALDEEQQLQAGRTEPRQTKIKPPARQETPTDGVMHSYSSTENQKKQITIEDVFTLRSIKRKSVNKFSDDDFRKAEKWAYRYKKLGAKSPFFRAWFGEWRVHSNDKIVVAEIPPYIDSNAERKKNRGSVVNNDTQWTISISREGETNTIYHSGDKWLSEYGLSGIQSLIENSVLLNTEVHEHHKNNPQNDYIAFDHKFYALGENDSGEINLYRITVEEYFQSKKEPANKKIS